jgi:hypothetical protein
MDDGKARFHPIEAVPFEELRINIDRREFFSTVLTELRLFANRRSGASGTKLSVLGVMELPRLGQIVPMLLPDCEVRAKPGAVYGYLKTRETEVFLFQRDPVLIYSFNQINGQADIKLIASRLSHKFCIPDEHALLIARGLFLTLVKAGVCVPGNNPLTG